MSVILDGTSGITTPGVTNSGNETISGTLTTTGAANVPNTFGFKNRIINGAMMIDQRNAGASVTIGATSTTYTLDRWNAYAIQASKFTVQQSTTAATGFVNSLLCTSSSAYSVLTGDYFVVNQRVEGLNMSDLAWGTASASTVTLSFWVRSSLTGTFGGAIQNNAQDRSYPFSYTISSANTWELKSVTIPGDTTGTWLTTNGIGMRVFFNLGSGATYSGTANTWAGASYFAPTGATSVVGTNGATFYITGVQLEKGSTATSFDYRPYGTELQLCQRYFQVIQGGCGRWAGGTGAASLISLGFQTTMRSAPTASVQGTVKLESYAGADATVSSVSTLNNTNINVSELTLALTGSTGNPANGYPTNLYVATGSASNSGIAFSAEL